MCFKSESTVADNYLSSDRDIDQKWLLFLHENQKILFILHQYADCDFAITVVWVDAGMAELIFRVRCH